MGFIVGHIEEGFIYIVYVYSEDDSSNGSENNGSSDVDCDIETDLL